ncbi:MAG: sugar transporter ATP-binding protein [Thermomicrobiales bacterium]|jgi:multiple sugar transport system permease protein|nr:sugar transporter ATP-binding protein [Thermomicrobiales bacterium]MDF3015446.1 sugar transporter ATP-binding protein [Thermomicrobiales bacterium]
MNTTFNARPKQGWGRAVATIPRIVLYLALVAGGLFMLMPFIWMFSSSLKDQGAIFAYPPSLIPPATRWSNFRDILDVVPFGRYFSNSLFIAALSVVGQLLSCSMAAFAWARIPFFGRNVLFMTLMAALIIPPQVTLVPLFIMMNGVGWIDTYYPLILPFWLGGAFGTFLLRQFFLAIPRDLEDAAKIDGAGPWRIYWSIYLPLCKPALATVAIFTFLLQWNELLRPLIFLSTPEKLPLTVGLAALRSQYSTSWNLIMAGALISVIPVLVLFVFAQRYFVRGVTSSGLKG